VRTLGHLLALLAVAVAALAFGYVIWTFAEAVL
jgi:hypothetical protein